MNVKKHIPISWLSWVQALGFLFILLLTLQIIPKDFSDPWGLFKPYKIVQMIFALALIQIIGRILEYFLDARLGMVVIGLLGGFVSSTAFTAALSKKSHHLSLKNITVESLSYLSATLAMLLQAFILVFIGFADFPLRLGIIFFGPLLVTLILMGIHSKNLPHYHFQIDERPLLDVISILKLTFFIVGLLTLSNSFKMFFGQSGLKILTFFISLFELHGSVIANVQLYDAKIIDLVFLSELLTLALIASYISKLIIVGTLGNSFLKKRVMSWTFLIILSILASWFASLYLS